MSHWSASFPRVPLSHRPTPLEPAPNLSETLGTPLWIKRDDCTGLAFGGNKARQLEWYLGDARARSADTILITGAVQSNYVRSAAAAAAKLGMAICVQLEERVPNTDQAYQSSGNALLNQLLGAVVRSYPEGEDEAGADQALDAWADELRREGRSPYVIHLGTEHPPLGALGYVEAAEEFLAQAAALGLSGGTIWLPSGSSHTHAGVLVGLALFGGSDWQVTGACVRRDAPTQTERVLATTERLARLLDVPNPVAPQRVRLVDDTLAPGYGRLNPETLDAMRLFAQKEGLILDPVYTGKAAAALVGRIRAQEALAAPVVFLHTGGTPALFGYSDALFGFLTD